MIDDSTVSRSDTAARRARGRVADIRPGEVTLLLGANGAGKSTLLRCILGVTACEGRIECRRARSRDDGRAVRALIGYMPQSGGLHPDLTVERDDVVLRRRSVARRAIAARALLDEAGLAAEREHARRRVVGRHAPATGFRRSRC